MTRDSTRTGGVTAPPSALQARALPFRGEFGAPVNLGELAAWNNAGHGARLLAALLKDPHLAAVDRDLHFADVLRRARQGAFDEAALLDCGRRAIAEYVRRARSELKGVFTRDASNI